MRFLFKMMLAPISLFVAFLALMAKWLLTLSSYVVAPLMLYIFGTGSSSGRAGSVAGSQSTGGHTRHGGCGSDLQKTFTGDLVHFAWFLSSCLFLLLYSFS